MDPPSAITQKADCVVVNLELQVLIAINAAAAAGGHGSDDSYQVVDVKARPTAGVVQQNHHVVVDADRLAIDVVAAGTTTSPKGHAAVEVIKPKDIVDDGEAGKNRCAACGEPMRWVTIGGRCGHRGVCSKCMVRDRFFRQNKRCCICNIHCPKVLVAKADDGVRGGAATPPKLPRFPFRDGRAGNYWYHMHTAAYFEEEKEYQAARVECEGIIPRFYEPLGVFAFWFGIFITGGVCAAIGFAGMVKNSTSKVGVCALSIFVMLLFATVTYSLPRCRKYEPHELEDLRLTKAYEQQCKH